MFSDFLSAIGGVDKYPIITLILFFSVFAGVIVYVFTEDKNKLYMNSLIPLNENKSEIEDEDKNKF